LSTAVLLQQRSTVHLDDNDAVLLLGVQTNDCRTDADKKYPKAGINISQGSALSCLLADLLQIAGVSVKSIAKVDQYLMQLTISQCLLRQKSYRPLRKLLKTKLKKLGGFLSWAVSVYT